ncbi:thiamine pyrophosphokinase [Cladophialophora psammophila CBS 110553]|uniref:Thiamine pyrophosphokinase n=1 Tax=Cladophialophora psammophila CBS 110553 TaxID=1182543 RepID=W9XGZ6_9EURO|nr:thiamine pyrophosphokinase [Cladophialophora psammophila CBS 110553]EXJ69634.1 thiamine pyrophosphokinase [Cladophialophora psammophila CBS 110553]
MVTDWYPCGLLNNSPTHPYAIIILNQPVNKNALNAVIGSASLLICADGGANRLYKYDKAAQNGLSRLRRRLPDAIVGDLDSLTGPVEEHYRSLGSQVIKDPDQFSTDFTKCLKWIRNWVISKHERGGSNYDKEPQAVMDVVVLGGLGGRVDQGFSQIHHLFMAENDPALLRGCIYLLSEQSLSFVLADGHNLIHLDPGYFTENVGILPVLGRTFLTTKGLEWDVEHWPTEFGDQVSTSNHIRSSEIGIAFEGPRPLFTMELEDRLTASGE